MLRSKAEMLLAAGGELELVGRTEAARIIGCARTNLKYHPHLPLPVITYLAAGELWLRSDIEHYAERRNLLKSIGARNRPAKSEKVGQVE